MRDFLKWLFVQRSRQDPIGDLARDAFNDIEWNGKLKSLEKTTKDTDAEDAFADALKEFVETNKLEHGLDVVNVQDTWKKMMGNGVNNYTTNIQLKNNTLYVQLSSSVLREELSYGKEKIISMLNESLGKEVIKKLVLG